MKLNPCPFCKSTDISAASYTETPSGYEAAVYCDECDASGPQVVHVDEGLAKQMAESEWQRCSTGPRRERHIIFCVLDQSDLEPSRSRRWKWITDHNFKARSIAPGANYGQTVASVVDFAASTGEPVVCVEMEHHPSQNVIRYLESDPAITTTERMF